MRDLFKTLICVLALGAATPALAQDAAAPQADPTLSLGQQEGEDKVGTTYVKEEHGDWQLRCVHAPEGQTDPCQLYQLLSDAENNPTAEISVFAVNGEQGAVAGATIATPLETLLTQQLRLAVDAGKAKVYPFTWCSQAGCFARVGFTAEDLAALKGGSKATLTIVPMAAPDQTVDLDISLKGFTAGFDAVRANNLPAK
ncbi:invasion associated locus B family protein [Actibacterium sp. MT2.3-13A]|uniref:invasion associated locus B family protein n=1 Tax=Actibacterium sp. MT2.3-13A TaxID=2828332 RepID=UPI001BAB833C|nr:invasion associated locus B family protein [Actibacterium sp. MT2.3-13A]